MALFDIAEILIPTLTIGFVGFWIITSLLDNLVTEDQRYKEAIDEYP